MKAHSKKPELNPDIKKHYRRFQLEPEKVHIFTDGSSSYRDKSGGWAAVLLYKGHRKEIFGGKNNTTNNEMELTAILMGIKALKETKAYPVVIYSDSQYCINAVTFWYKKWQRNGWINSKGEAVKNIDLIKEIISLSGNFTFKWVKGHIGIPENERADELAGRARKNVREKSSAAS